MISRSKPTVKIVLAHRSFPLIYELLTSEESDQTQSETDKRLHQ